MILTLVLVLVLAFAFILSILFSNFVLILGVLVPIIVFLFSYLMMSGLKRKILARLANSFGENVTRVAMAIIEFFEVPMTILLAVSLTLFFLVYIPVLFVLGGLDQLQRLGMNVMDLVAR